MYNSRTKSTLCPAPLPERPTKFPATQQLLQYQKIRRVLFPCACGRFILFSHYVSGDAVRTSLRVHPSLHCVQFISPTSAPHSIGGLVAPFHNPRSHSTSLSGCNPRTNQSTHKQPVKLHFIPQPLFHYTPNPPMPFSNAFPKVYFLPLHRVSPINRLKAEGKVITPYRCVIQASPTWE